MPNPWEATREQELAMIMVGLYGGYAKTALVVFDAWVTTYLMEYARLSIVAYSHVQNEILVVSLAFVVAVYLLPVCSAYDAPFHSLSFSYGWAVYCSITYFMPMPEDRYGTEFPPLARAVSAFLGIAPFVIAPAIHIGYYYRLLRKERELPEPA